MRNSYIIILFISVCFLFACDKNELRLTEYTLPTDKAYIRFALFSPGTPSVMIKVNNEKVNGSTTSGAVGYFPSVVTSPDYASVQPNATFRLSLPNTGTANDSVLIFNGNFAVDAGKFYAVTLADTGADRTVFPIEDKLTTLADSGYFKLRFVNAMPKTPSVNLIRVDSTDATIVTRDTIARNIAYKSATDFIKTSISPLLIPNSNPKAYYSFTRFRVVTTTGVPLASSTPLSSTTLNQRTMTIYGYGYANGTGIYTPTISTYVFNQ